MIEGLEHLQFVIDHFLVPPDILLQDNLDGDLLRAGLRFTNNAIGAGT